MTAVLYDLVGRDDRRFSPNCWRSRMALAHKGLDCEARATRFTEIPNVADGLQKTLPVLQDGGRLIADSWQIATYLEEAYPERPSLFGGETGRALTVFVQNWVNGVLHPGVAGFVIKDIHDHLTEPDRAYFRGSREKRFGLTLEEVQQGRERRVAAFRAALLPLRGTLQVQPWLGGERPIYADYLAFGAFQWARTVSRFRLLEPADPVAAWFRRSLDLYDGLGRRTPGYDD